MLYSYVHVTFYWSTNSIVLEWYELIGVNLKKTIDYLRAAWNSVTAVTIKNCFCKAGFTDTVAIDDESIAFEDFTDNDLMDDLGWFLEDTHITFDQFVEIDDDVETYEMPTEEEIIAMSITEAEVGRKIRWRWRRSSNSSLSHSGLCDYGNWSSVNVFGFSGNVRERSGNCSWLCCTAQGLCFSIICKTLPPIKNYWLFRG